ncbi:darcynin family protein [Agaribacterium haliotis]|uniref:darcynin family protein n=1 Tax=Agaribacterium haliotis TaxID=2013869 RepID=UPI000BB590F6|nr:darcynin family protein [Agaribacterium haliotis]
MKYTIIIKYSFLPAWFALSRADRQGIERDVLAPLLAEFKDTVSMKMYDAEAFHADFSDFAVLNVSCLKSYGFFIDKLKDSILFSQQYMQFVELFTGVESSYKQFDKEYQV